MKEWLDMGIKNFKKAKKIAWGLFFFVVLLLFITTLGLQSYLYRIQQDERLSGIDNYLDYDISIRTQKKREKKFQFQYENDYYYYDGIEEIFISYGSTTAFLEEMIEKQYLTVEDMTKNMELIPSEEENVRWYVHNSSQENQRFIIQIVTQENDREIIFQNYSESTLQSLGYVKKQQK